MKNDLTIKIGYTESDRTYSCSVCVLSCHNN